MSPTLYVASSNPGKLRDFALAASAHHIAILALPGLANIPAPPEDAPTFHENARSKAEYYSRFLPGEMVLSDDSGLEVDWLQGAPGVRSARYAEDAGFHGSNKVDANNNLFLLQQLEGVAENERGARYRCALAAARDGTAILAAEGSCAGKILTEPRGKGGFGYDPLFYVDKMKQTMAELDPGKRWAISHRGLAFQAFLQAR